MTDRCKYCGQEERYGHNAICVMNTVEELRADNARLRALVKELADDLEEELRGHYAKTMDYPSELRRFERDMTSVYKARHALENKP